jgi:hypothetical protein
VSSSCSRLLYKFPTEGITVIKSALTLSLDVQAITGGKRMALEILRLSHIEDMEDSLENIEVVLIIEVIGLKSVSQLVVLDVKLSAIKTSESIISSGDIFDLKNSDSSHVSPPCN